MYYQWKNPCYRDNCLFRMRALSISYNSSIWRNLTCVILAAAADPLVKSIFIKTQSN